MATYNKKTIFNTLQNLDTRIEMVKLINFVYAETGHKISFESGVKIEHVWGKVADPGTTAGTGMLIGQMAKTSSGGTPADFETLPTTNAYGRVMSFSTATVDTCLVRGQTLTDGKFSEILEEEVVLENEYSNLTRSLARVVSVYNTSARDDDWDGPAYIYQVSGINTGLAIGDEYPSDVTKIGGVSMDVDSTEVNNEIVKASITIPDGYVGLFRNVYVGMPRASNTSYFDATLQIAEYGKPFLNKLFIAGGTAADMGNIEYPYVYALPNSDVRLAAQVSATSSTQLMGGMSVLLVPIIT